MGFKIFFPHNCTREVVYKKIFMLIYQYKSGQCIHYFTFPKVLSHLISSSVNSDHHDKDRV